MIGDSSEEQPVSNEDSGQLIFLSLFLLLLAFFILLNALATIEETRSRQVLTSVAATFRSLADPDTTAQVRVSDLGLTPQPQDLMDMMERIWVTAIAVTKVETPTSGEIMQLSLPANELFLGGEPRLRADRRPLLERVAATLARSAPGHVNDLELVLGSEPVDEKLLAAGGTLAMKRAAVLARTLVEHGAPADTIAVGIREGDEGILRMRFAIRASDRAHARFRSVAQ